MWSELAMKSAKVSELKARLSAYLSAVRAGEEVVVFDRRTPIARVIPWEERTDADLPVEEPIRRLPRLSDLPRVRLLRRVDVVRLLRESRDQR